MTARPTISYPYFVPNQLLNSADLNNLIEYLDQQNRLTRSYLFGMGILYGLELKWKEDGDKSTIIISEGVGLSSKGFLFDIGDIELRSYTEVMLEAKELMCEETITDDIGSSYTMWELLEGENGSVISELFADQSLEDIVVLLFWDQGQNIQEASFSQCSQVKGETNVAIRVLATTKEVAEEITKSFSVDSLSTEALPGICLPRFGLQGDSTPEINTGEIVSFRKFVQNYKEICTAAVKTDTATVGSIAAAYISVAERFAELLFKGGNLEPDNFADLEAHLIGRGEGEVDQEGAALPAVVGLLQQVVESANGKGIQYFYDFLKDLVLAYDEFADTKFAQTLSGKPDRCLFPHHNLLGRIHKSEDEVKVFNDYRTKLIQSPVEGLGNSDFDQAKQLYVRMMDLAARTLEDVVAEGVTKKGARFTNVNLPLPYPMQNDPQEPKIKITPSKGKWFPLSERAIPYYYAEESVSGKGKDFPIRENWSFKETDRNRQERIPAYYPVPTTSGSGNTASLEPLLCDMDAYNFFRIEGHLYKEVETALQVIRQERQRLNLPFDIRCLKLDLKETKFNLGEGSTILPGHVRRLLKVRDLELSYKRSRIELLCHSTLQEVNLGDNAAELKDFLTTTKELAEFVANYDQFKQLFDSVFDSKEAACRKAFYQTLKDTYQNRQLEVEAQLTFPVFAQKHPGLEHGAGVPKGGTFVLLYVDSLSEANQSSVRELLKERIPSAQAIRGAAFENKAEPAFGNPKWGGSRFSWPGIVEYLAFSSPPMTSIIIDQKEFDKYSTCEAGLIYLARKYSIGLHLIKREVIADFCLPYLCCSEAPPVFTQSTAPPLIIFPQDRFCSEDDPIPGTVFPAGGKFADVPWVIPDTTAGNEGKFLFDPQKVPPHAYSADLIAKVPIAYLFGGQLASVGAKVYWKPKAVLQEKIEPMMKNCQLIGFTYTLQSKSVLQLVRDGEPIGLAKSPSIQWIVNGIKKGTTTPLVLEVQLDGTAPSTNLDVKLIASRSKWGLCQDVVDKSYPVTCPDPLSVQPLAVELIPNTPLVNPADVGPTGEQITSYVYPLLTVTPITVGGSLSLDPLFFGIEVDPAGGYFEITGYTTDDNGDIVFDPADGSATTFEVPDIGDHLITSDPPECKHSFIYGSVNRVTSQLQLLDPGLYRFEYKFLCGTKSAVAWVRLVLDTEWKELLDDQDQGRLLPSFSGSMRGRSGPAGRARKGKSKAEKSTPKPDVPTAERATAPPSPVPETEASEGLAVLGHRHAARVERISSLETDSSLTQTKTYLESKDFALSDSRDMTDLEKGFEEVMNLLINTRSRAKGVRLDQCNKLIEIVIHSFCDKIVAAREEKMADSTNELLGTTLTRLKSKNIDVEAIWATWNGEGLKTAATASTIEELEILFNKA